jgi:hypothetical protein
MPAGFCANAAPPPDIAISNTLAAAARSLSSISLSPCFIGHCERSEAISVIEFG